MKVVASSFSFEDLSITGAKGGDGGAGGQNAPAQVGAARQSCYSGSSAVGGACVGGTGGWGGASGAGVGGNGGPGFGIAFVNSAEVANVMSIAISQGASGEVGLPGDTQGDPSGAACAAAASIKGHPGSVNKYQMFNA